MIATFEVDVALSRPPRTDATVYVTIAEPLDETLPLSKAFDRAVARAAETAMNMTVIRPQVVMAVAYRLVDVVA